MRLSEVKKMNRSEVAYMLLLARIVHQNFTVDGATINKFRNAHGNLVTDISFSLSKSSGYSYLERIRLYDDDYIWFLSALALDFPDIEITDKSREKSYENR